MTKSELPTVEEILDKAYQSGMHWKSVNRKNVILAMIEYGKLIRKEVIEAAKKNVRIKSEPSDHIYHGKTLYENVIDVDSIDNCFPESNIK